MENMNISKERYIIRYIDFAKKYLIDHDEEAHGHCLECSFVLINVFGMTAKEIAKIDRDNGIEDIINTHKRIRSALLQLMNDGDKNYLNIHDIADIDFDTIDAILEYRNKLYELDIIGTSKEYDDIERFVNAWLDDIRSSKAYEAETMLYQIEDLDWDMK